MEELAEGRDVWSDIETTVSGEKATITACRQWGVILLNGNMVVLERYPLQELQSISPSQTTEGGISARLQPLIEDKKITAKYRVVKKTDTQVFFVPVQREHALDDGAVIDLVDLHFNLNDKAKGLGEMNVGDEKEFTLNVKVLTGYRPLPTSTPTGEN